tara:strand:+ start:146 stop:559 length:414 start_codon:yes stop_codon:yes gene_type:complete
MTLQEMMNNLDQFGESLNDLQPELESLMSEIVGDMKRNAPVDTGALRNSIRGEATSNSMTIFMNDYGNFQNYGVGPSPKNGTIKKVEFGISPRPSSEPFYMFKTRKFGLRAKDWFSLEEIKDQFAEELGAEIIARTF